MGSLKPLFEPAADVDIDTLLARLTDVRAGYLDNINNANIATIANISSLTATEIAHLNADIDSRAPSGEYDTQLDANMSTRAPASEYDTQLDANMSTRAPASEYDTEMARITANVATEAKQDVIDAKIGPPMTTDNLLLAAFLAPTPVGTMVDPEYLTDGNTGTIAKATNVGEDAIIDLGAAYTFTQFRHFGNVTINGDGEWKIQIWTGGAWVDWATFVTRATADWAGWVNGDHVSAARYLRLVNTVQDTSGGNWMTQLEVKY